jgi:hypothetical protein
VPQEVRRRVRLWIEPAGGARSPFWSATATAITVAIVIVIIVVVVVVVAAAQVNLWLGLELDCCWFVGV